LGKVGAARVAWAAAFQAEAALREEHARAVDKLRGEVRALFPRDRSRQDTVFPPVDTPRHHAEEAEPAPAAPSEG
jgi:AmiR/NasT family two-component response regulator